MDEHAPSAADALRRAAGRNLHEKIANTLGAAIIGGDPAPGAALPTEIELCGRLGVSRSALREAFKLLVAKRLIASRQKVGTTVRPQAEWNMLDLDVLTWFLHARPSDAFVTGLFEVRAIIEPAAAAMAAERAAPDSAAAVTASLSAMRRAQDGHGDLLAADLAFHQAVLRATENHFLASFATVIEGSLAASFHLSWEVGGQAPTIAVKLHQDVADAIAAHQPEAARAAMDELLRGAMADVRLGLVSRRLSPPAPSGRSTPAPGAALPATPRRAAARPSAARHTRPCAP